MRSVSKLEMQRRATGKAPGHSSRPQHPAPYLRPRTGKPSKRSTRPTLCFQHVGPTSYGPRSGVAHPAGNGLVLHLLRATVWCCASCGPRLGVSPPSGHGLVFRILRAAVWCFASGGPRFGVANPAGHGLVFRILRAAAEVLHIGGAPYCFQWVRADDLAGRSLVVLRIGKTSGLLGVGRTPEVLYIGGAYVVSHIEKTTGWCGISEGLEH